jgi:hypothetical protein
MNPDRIKVSAHMRRRPRKPADPIVSELLYAHLLDVLPKWLEQDRLKGWPEDVVQRIQGGGGAIPQ